MSADHNRALQRATGSGWLVVWAIRDERDAFLAARQGWWAAAWLSVVYLASAVITVHPASYYGALGPPDTVRSVAAVDFGLAALGATLAVVIRQMQARWAAVALLIWASAELLLKVLESMLSGNRVSPSLLDVALVLFGIVCVRGAFLLVKHRRQGPDVDQVFA
jgi:hypothetical protein